MYGWDVCEMAAFTLAQALAWIDAHGDLGAHRRMIMTTFDLPDGVALPRPRYGHAQHIVAMTTLGSTGLRLTPVDTDGRPAGPPRRVGGPGTVILTWSDDITWDKP